MRITTWNVNGLRAREGEIAEWVLRQKPDVLCLQEIKATLSQVPESISQLDGYHCYWHGLEGGYSGVALHIRTDLVKKRPVFSHPPFDFEGRIVTAALGDLDVASIYLPNGGKDLPAKMRFLEGLEGWVKESHARGRKLLLCGDLNVALTPRDVHPSLANPGQTGQTPEEREWMSRIFSHGLDDLLRRFAPNDDQLFTWWAPWRNHRARNIGWRLDYVLASTELARKAKGCHCEREFGSSDHAPVTATFEGPLFDAASVAEGVEQPMPPRSPPAAVPQLELF